MRICFQGPGPTEFRPATPIPYSTGTPPLASSIIKEIQRPFTITGNKGNLFHAEAPPKLFRKNEARSCIANLVHMQNAWKDDYPRRMGEFFDAVVISMANFIRPHQDHSRLAAAIEAIPERVTIAVLGGGIQNAISPEELNPSTMELVRVFNKRCTIFGVRGEETSRWLKAHGFHNHVVLGCPSLYVFPRSLMGLSYDNIPHYPRAVSAGHLSRPKLTGNSSTMRGVELVSAFQNIAADYVFQDEIFSFSPLMETVGFYDEPTGECDAGMVLDYLNTLSDKPIPFSKFYFFHSTAAWRQMYRAYDMYVGDRFHGGVGALQAKVPAIFLQHDSRVSELTNFFSLPTMTIAEFHEIGLRGAINKSLSRSSLARLKQVYMDRIQNFAAVMGTAGFEMANLPEIDSVTSKVPA